MLVLAPVGTGVANAVPTASSGVTHHWTKVAVPVGVWTTDIDFGGGQMVHVRQSYTNKGELCHRAVGEGSLGYGKGSWKPTGANGTFSYAVVEKFHDSNGNGYFGKAEMTGTATISGSTFTAHHHSRIYDAAGNFLDEGDGVLIYQRVSTANPKCPATP